MSQKFQTVSRYCRKLTSSDFQAFLTCNVCKTDVKSYIKGNIGGWNLKLEDKKYMEVERGDSRREKNFNQSRLVALLSKSPLSSYNSHERFYRRR